MHTYSLRKLAHAIYRDFFRSINLKFHRKNFDIFNIFAQNIHYGYTLKPPYKNSKGKTGSHTTDTSKDRKQKLILQYISQGEEIHLL